MVPDNVLMPETNSPLSKSFGSHKSLRSLPSYTNPTSPTKDVMVLPIGFTLGPDGNPIPPKDFELPPPNVPVQRTRNRHNSSAGLKSFSAIPDELLNPLLPSQVVSDNSLSSKSPISHTKRSSSLTKVISAIGSKRIHDSPGRNESMNGSVELRHSNSANVSNQPSQVSALNFQSPSSPGANLAPYLPTRVVKGGKNSKAASFDLLAGEKKSKHKSKHKDKTHSSESGKNSESSASVSESNSGKSIPVSIETPSSPTDRSLKTKHRSKTIKETPDDSLDSSEFAPRGKTHRIKPASSSVTIHDPIDFTNSPSSGKHKRRKSKNLEEMKAENLSPRKEVDNLSSLSATEQKNSQ